MPLLTLIIAILLANSPVFAANVTASDEVDFSADEIIIKFKNKKNSPKAHEYLASKIASQFQSGLLSGSQTQRLRTARSKKRVLSDVVVLKLPADMDKSELKELVRQIKAARVSDTEIEVEDVSPNYIFKGSAAVASTTTQALTSTYDNYQWAGDKGEGAIVAVIDSGVNYSHPDLAANIWENPGEIANNGKDDDNNGYIDDVRGWDFVKKATGYCALGEDCNTPDNDPMDFDGHGSHVSGIIAAVADNNIGTKGVAPKSRIMPIRASYSDGKSTYLKSSDIYDAIAYAIDNKADVINMSFAGPELNILSDILGVADEMGIVLVAAAGNNGKPYQQYPAALPCVIAVGAVDENNERAYFSNYGDWVDIAAPGTQILSLGGTRKSYEVRSGTSMATPYVAGIAALIKAKNKVRSLTASDIRARILASSVESSFVPVLSANVINPVEVDDMQFDEIIADGDEVKLKAKAIGASEYKWDSNLDGDLGSSAELDVDKLSVGTHQISVSVEDSDGKWSKPVTKVLHVVESDQVAEISAEKIALDIVRAKNGLGARSAGSASKKIAHYLWQSDIDGQLPDSKTIALSSLSPGFHKITLSIQDKQGNISTSVEQVIQRR